MAAIFPVEHVATANSSWCCVVVNACESLFGTTNTLSIVTSVPVPPNVKWNTPVIITNHKRYSGVWKPIEVSEDRLTLYCELPSYAEGKSSDVPLHDWSIRIPEEENRNIAVCKPVYDESSATKIQIAPALILNLRCNIFNINKVDTISQTFVADVFFEGRLRGISDVDNISHVEEMLDVYGLTKDMFVMLNTDVELETWQTFVLGDHMTTYDYAFKFRGKGEFAEEFELENFPFDEQFLNLSVSVLRPDHLVRLVSNEQFPSTFVSSSFQLSNIFRVVYQDLVLTKRSFSNARESASGLVYPRITFSVLFLRKSMYYVTNIVLPMVVLTYLCFLSFSVGFDGNRLDTSDRLSITLTLLLTAVAYKFVVASAIPQVSYLTLLDQHISFCFAFLCVIIAENALFPFLVTRSAFAVSEDDEIYVFYALLGLFTIVTLVWFLRIVWWMSCREKYYSMKFVTEQVHRIVSQTFKEESDAQRHKLTRFVLLRCGIDLAMHPNLIYFADPSHIETALPVKSSSASTGVCGDEKWTDHELLHMELSKIFASDATLEKVVVLLQRQLEETSTLFAEQQLSESKRKRKKG